MPLQEIIKNESVTDFLTFFALTVDYRIIDRLYTNNRFEALATGELYKTYHKLFDNGTFSNGNGKIVKGPNWKEPKFVTEKKYDLSEFSKKMRS